MEKERKLQETVDTIIQWAMQKRTKEIYEIVNEKDKTLMEKRYDKHISHLYIENEITNKIRHVFTENDAYAIRADEDGPYIRCTVNKEVHNVFLKPIEDEVVVLFFIFNEEEDRYELAIDREDFASYEHENVR